MGQVGPRVRTFATQHAIPASTPQSAPVTQTVDLGQTQLIEVEVVIPNGHVGLTGLLIRVGDTQVVPWTNTTTTFLVGNNEVRRFDCNTQAGAGIVVRAFNTDVLQHSFYVRWTVDDNQYLTVPQRRLIVPV